MPCSRCFFYGESSVKRSFNVCVYCIKVPVYDKWNFVSVLRRLVTFGIRDPASNQEAMSFLNEVFVKLDSMLACSKFDAKAF